MWKYELRWTLTLYKRLRKNINMEERWPASMALNLSKLGEAIKEVREWRKKNSDYETTEEEKPWGRYPVKVRFRNIKIVKTDGRAIVGRLK